MQDTHALKRLLDDATREPSPELLGGLFRQLQRRGLGLPRVSELGGRMWSACEADSLAALDLIFDVVRGADAIAGVHLDGAEHVRFELVSGRALGAELVEGEVDVLEHIVAAAGLGPRRLEVIGEHDVLPVTYVLERVTAELNEIPAWREAICFASAGTGGVVPGAPRSAAVHSPSDTEEVRARLREARTGSVDSLDALARALGRSAPGRRPVPVWMDLRERLAVRALDAVLDVVRGEDRVVSLRGGHVVSLGLSGGVTVEVANDGGRPGELVAVHLPPDGARLGLDGGHEPQRRPALFTLADPLSDCLAAMPGWIDALIVACRLGTGREAAWSSAR